MFSKVLILVLLGTTLVLASPVSQDVSVKAQTRSWANKGKEWFQQAEGAIKDYAGKIKTSFEEFLEGIKNRGETAVKIGKEKLAELKKQYEELKQKAEESLEQQKKIWEARLEEWKHKGGDAVGAGKEKFEELKEKAKEAIQQEKAKWEAKLNELKEKVKEAIEAAKGKIHPGGQ